MFERVIAQTIQKITTETLQDRAVIPLLDILQDARIPARIKPFFETEVHWWLYNDALARAANKRFDYDHPELAALLNYIEQVQFRHARFEREEFTAVLDSAVKLTYNYLCRPQTTLKWYIFRGQPVKPLNEVLLRFSAFVDYPYFRDVFTDWVDRKRAERPTFDAISATEFERVIRRIDDQILLNCTVEGLLEMMEPLFDFIGEGTDQLIPVDALVIFFDDKNIKKLVDQLEEYHNGGGHAVGREGFVVLLDELLSSADDEPEADFSSVYQNDALDDVVREHLRSGGGDTGGGYSHAAPAEYEYPSGYEPEYPAADEPDTMPVSTGGTPADAHQPATPVDVRDTPAEPVNAVVTPAAGPVYEAELPGAEGSEPGDGSMKVREADAEPAPSAYEPPAGGGVPDEAAPVSPHDRGDMSLHHEVAGYDAPPAGASVSGTSVSGAASPEPVQAGAAEHGAAPEPGAHGVMTDSAEHTGTSSYMETGGPGLQADAASDHDHGAMPEGAPVLHARTWHAGTVIAAEREVPYDFDDDEMLGERSDDILEDAPAAGAEVVVGVEIEGPIDWDDADELVPSARRIRTDREPGPDDEEDSSMLVADEDDDDDDDEPVLRNFDATSITEGLRAIESAGTAVGAGTGDLPANGMALDNLPDVRRCIDPALERKVVKKIFKKRRSEYDAVLDRLNGTTTWREASHILDEAFIRNEVDPYMRTAIRFTDSVYGRYLPAHR
ncbi:MAG TPA: hypothetical protein VHI13_19760 [Candidatus Kapabacteria bacterium]|nr:hypothetical protein [Candidatus Kapabacteria bacterium]